MQSYNSNVIEVLGKLRNQLVQLKGPVLEKMVRSISFDLVGSNLDRIHTYGKAVDGSLISTGSSNVEAFKSKKTGKVSSKKKRGSEATVLATPYSQKYAKKRIDKGRQIAKVDLSFTGKLSKEFNLEAKGPKEIGVGFTTPYASDLSEVLENKYGKKIWGTTQEDERVAQEYVKNTVIKLFK